jgi:hypothetical protein
VRRPSSSLSAWGFDRSFDVLPFCGLSGCGNDLQAPFPIVGNGGQANLNACLCKSSPTHPTQAVASLSCSEDLLDATANAMDRLVPGLQACPYFGFVATHIPVATKRRAAPGDDCLAETVATISAVGINIAGIIRQCFGTSLAVVDVGWLGEFWRMRRP